MLNYSELNPICLNVAMNSEFIPRENYLRALRSVREKPLIKVITGVRRCGKTTLMKRFIDELKTSGVQDNQIVQVNFEDYDAIPLRAPNALHAFLTSKLQPGKTVFFFLDEIQTVPDFESVIDRLATCEGVDIYLAGSNGTKLCSGLTTWLTGRYVEIKILPLSFSEFVEGGYSTGTLSDQYRQYLEGGALPYALALPNAEAVDIYFEGTFNTILLKDVLQRMKLSDSLLLLSICRFLCEHIGSIVSPKRIADELTAQGRKCDSKTVDKYLTALVDSFIFYEARRFDVLAKVALARLARYYLVDVGLRPTLLGHRAMDAGHTLQNVVYLELLRRGYEVYVGRLGDAEVDFVVKSADGFQYIQVAETARSTETIERKLKPLQKIQDHYPTLLLTLDEGPTKEKDGIVHMNALEWLVKTS